ncbi:MAG: phage tail assembly chaperone [Parvibaculaceae bacterium]|nr:phage tail assembly chaperone [Parvibaculaceae bacterium]
MRACAGHLKLPPNEFWNLRITDLAMLLGEPGGALHLDRETFDKLQEAYPDNKRPDDRGD